MSKGNPKVSVIIPNFNHGKFLGQRIDSVLEQTFQDFEVIILDDCSPDNSREIMERYRKHPKVSRIVYNDANSNNTFKQWNKGIGLAAGEFIWLAESDDYCEPSFLSELVPPLLSNPNVVLCYCQSMFFSDSGKILFITEESEIHSIINGKDFALERMMGLNGIPNASMAVFRKSVFENIPDDYTNMRYCGDWMFWTYICLQGDVSVSGKVLNYYRRHDNNVATKAVKEGLDFLEGNKIFEYLKSNCSPSDKQIEKAARQRMDSYFHLKRHYDPTVNKLVVNSLKNIKSDVEKLILVMNLKSLARKILLNR